MNLYDVLKVMMPAAEKIGYVHEARMGDWVADQEHIVLKGKTEDGRGFELSLEINKEAKEDA